MAEPASEPTRKVRLTFFEEPVERTEAQIEELRRGGLLREDGDPPSEVIASVAAPAASSATAAAAVSKEKP